MQIGYNRDESYACFCLFCSMPKKEYSPYKAYADSKLAVVLGTQELQRRIYRASRRVTVNSLHPGVVSSQLYQNMHPLIQMAKIVVAQLGLIWVGSHISVSCSVLGKFRVFG